MSEPIRKLETRSFFRNNSSTNIASPPFNTKPFTPNLLTLCRLGSFVLILLGYQNFLDKRHRTGTEYTKVVLCGRNNRKFTEALYFTHSLQRCSCHFCSFGKYSDLNRPSQAKVTSSTFQIIASQPSCE